MSTSRITPNTLCFVLCAWCAGAAAAQHDAASSYPTRPIRLLVGFSPGGANDIVARVVAEDMTASLGKQIIVDNRPGASGRIANAIAADADGDGQTLLIVPISFALDVARGAKLKYDPKRDFVPTILLASAPFVLVVNPALPVRSTKDLIAMARSQPGKLNGAHTGIGNMTHVLLEMFKSLADLKIVSVPYKGGGPALVDVMSGEMQLIFTGMPPALPHIKSGRVRLIAVTSEERSSLMPDVPTVAESGVSGYGGGGWWGILAPRGTPPAIVDRVNREANQALQKKAISERLSSLGATPIGGSQKKFSDFIDAEIRKWAEVMTKAGIAGL